QGRDSGTPARPQGDAERGAAARLGRGGLSALYTLAGVGSGMPDPYWAAAGGYTWGCSRWGRGLPARTATRAGGGGGHARPYRAPTRSGVRRLCIGLVAVAAEEFPRRLHGFREHV